MSTALTQRAVEILEERLGYPPFGVLNSVRGKDLIAAMEQYHREAREAELNAWKQWWRGEASAQPASVEPVAKVIFTSREKPDVEWLTDTVVLGTLLFTTPPDAEALRKRAETAETQYKTLIELIGVSLGCEKTFAERGDEFARGYIATVIPKIRMQAIKATEERNEARAEVADQKRKIDALVAAADAALAARKDAQP